ncbi:MAG: hypothetical protein ACK506_13880 [Pirellula sp.]|jgi:hypothetical protein
MTASIGAITKNAAAKSGVLKASDLGERVKASGWHEPLHRVKASGWHEPLHGTLAHAGTIWLQLLLLCAK